ncbi:hypothetical protein BHE74_00027858 [Ensete ventricosum]|nr:hypothetical protein GW17_00032715 [Ensete ventricosum]RWW64872.1 hypothetical protein BHE74_00027858 [Ensete ventricosum]
MAFGDRRASNYVRIQVNPAIFDGMSRMVSDNGVGVMQGCGATERGVESVLFQGRKLSEQTNGEKLDLAAAELIKEHERRKRSGVPTVVLKPSMTLARSSSSC